MNAFILAGGQSTRMGRDKAMLVLGGRPLIEHALSKLRALGFSPRIVGSRPDLTAFAPVISDLHPASGPLAGIEAALAAVETRQNLFLPRQNLFLPIDLPWIPEEFLRWLVERAAGTDAMATIPRLQGHSQPLCAVYNMALLPYAQAALAAKDGKVMRAVEHAAHATGMRIDSFDMETISAAQDWDQARPLHRWFQNLNTFADYEKAILEQSTRIY